MIVDNKIFRFLILIAYLHYKLYIQSSITLLSIVQRSDTRLRKEDKDNKQKLSSIDRVRYFPC